MDEINSTKSNIYKHPTKESESHNPKELAYVYSFQMFNQNTFDEQFTYLESLIGDFTAHTSKDDNQYLSLRKTQMSLKSIKNIFDIQTMIS